MTHEEKITAFLSKTGRDAFKTKTPLGELPILFQLGSSSHKPDKKVMFETADLVFWVKFLDKEFFRPYGGFSQEQIIGMIDLCYNDNQIVSLMELLSATND